MADTKYSEPSAAARKKGVALLKGVMTPAGNSVASAISKDQGESSLFTSDSVRSASTRLKDMK